MNKKILLFWIGDMKKIKVLTNKIKSFNLEYEVGPSSREHKYLMEKSRYYRESFEGGKFSFCSDVWRFYRLSKEPSIYIDTSVTIGDDFMDFYKILNQPQNWFFRERAYLLGSAIMASGTERLIFSNCYDFFCSDICYLTSHIAPHVLTYFSAKMLDITFPSFNSVDIKENTISTIFSVRDNRRLVKHGSNSWNKKIADSIENDVWRYTEEEFSKKVIYKWDKKEFDDLITHGPSFSFKIAKLNYEGDTTKGQRSLIAQIYKENKYIYNKISISERLIWSKFFRVFNMLKILQKD